MEDRVKKMGSGESPEPLLSLGGAEAPLYKSTT
jgi:hypothetical protein